MTWLQQTGEFRLGDFTVQSGETIRDARLVWKSHGALSPQRDNVVLYPCSYGAKHEDLEWLIGPDRILDPTRWFIVIPNMFSNGVSSGAAETPEYPRLVTSWDSVQAQRRLLAEQFDVRCNAVVHEKTEAVLRESLGGMSHLGWHPPIGQRTSMLVPWGGLSLAWDGDEAIAQWMAAMDLGPGSEDGKAFLAAVERARQRGYYFGVRHQGWVNEMAQAPVEQRRELTDFSLLELDDAASYPLASVIAPVRDETGVVLILVLSGLTHAVSGAQIREIGEALKAACGRVSDFLVAAAGAAGATG